MKVIFYTTSVKLPKALLPDTESLFDRCPGVPMPHVVGELLLSGGLQHRYEEIVTVGVTVGEN